jgi:hypothetical protein
MLLTSGQRKAVLVLPVLLFVFATGMGVVTVGAFLSGPSWGAVIGCGLFASFVFWMAFDELALVRVDGATLRVWGPFRRRELRAQGVAFGVRLQAGSRSSRYVVFASDGQQRVDIGEWQTQRGARGGVERLSRALYGNDPRTPNARAVREVEGVEREWQATLSEAQSKVDEYYKSPGWRRSKFIVLGVLVAYVIGMMLYQYFTGQL